MKSLPSLKSLAVAALFLALVPSEQSWAQAAGPGEAGQKILQAPQDPSFDEVAALYPGMKLPREAVGVKDGANECVVLPDGKLMFGDVGDAAAKQVSGWLENSAPGGVDWHALGSNGPLPRKKLLHGYLPIVLSRCERDGLEYEQEVLGWSEDMGPDSETHVLLRCNVSNPGKTPKTLWLRFQVMSEGVTNTLTAWDDEISPGGQKSVFLEMPHSAPKNGEQVSRARYEHARKVVQHYWDGLLSQGAQIVVPEARVNEAWRAWMIYNFIDVDKRNGKFEPHDGSGFYEEVYGYSAALYCRMLDIMGYHKQAEAYLASLRSFITSEGLFTLNFGLPDTGALLWAMAEHYRFTGDKQWLRSAAPDMIRMCDWVIKTRKEAIGGQTPEDPWFGLIKFRPYCDDPVPAYSYFTDTYLCVGLHATAEVLKGIGMSSEASRILAEAGAYRRDVLQSMEKSIVKTNGARMLPIYPETKKLLKDNGFTGRDYYGLVAGNLLETSFFSPSDPPARLLVDALEHRGGLALGMAVFRDGIDHAYTFGYWKNALEQGHVKKVLLGFYGSLAYGMSRETYSAVEVTRFREGLNEHTLPHLYSNTQQQTLLRSMLLYELGDDLLICPATPRDWLRDGAEIRVERAPTGFGNVSFRIQSSKNSVEMRLEPKFAQAPRSVRIRLRHPSGKPIAAVNARNVVIKGDVLILESPSRPLTLRVDF